jgi:sugar lactone lactonase YvrE
MSTGEEGLWPAWSPDATTLAWLTNEATGDVRIVPADGATTSRTIPRTGIARPPAWSPDGRFIYGLDDRRTTVIVIAVDGSAPAVGIPHAPSQGLPDWQRAIAP